MLDVIYGLVTCVTAYENLQSREETRNSAWLKEGWDVNVYYTGRRDANRPHIHVYSKEKNLPLSLIRGQLQANIQHNIRTVFSLKYYALVLQFCFKSAAVEIKSMTEVEV